MNANLLLECIEYCVRGNTARWHRTGEEPGSRDLPARSRYGESVCDLITRIHRDNFVLWKRSNDSSATPTGLEDDAGPQKEAHIEVVDQLDVLLWAGREAVDVQSVGNLIDQISMVDLEFYHLLQSDNRGADLDRMNSLLAQYVLLKVCAANLMNGPEEKAQEGADPRRHGTDSGPFGASAMKCESAGLLALLPELIY